MAQVQAPSESGAAAPVTILGGIAGVLLSIALEGTFEKLFNIPMEFSFKVVIFALIFSFLM